MTRDKANRFRELHHGGDVLVLPNAWDVATAVIFAEAGFPAVGTTSAGMAALYGYPDAEGMTCEEVLDLVRRITPAIDVPLTVDIEAGYGDVSESVRGVLEAGGVGVNIEDADQPFEDALANIKAAREASGDIVINARTDSYWRGRGDYEETARRGNAYLDAGADCVFVPLVSDEETIGRLVRDIRGPVNMLAGPGVPSIADMRRLGVARVSVGSGVARASLALVRDAAQELLDRGTYSFTEKAIPYPQVNAMLRG